MIYRNISQYTYIPKCRHLRVSKMGDYYCNSQSINSCEGRPNKGPIIYCLKDLFNLVYLKYGFIYSYDL